MALKILAEAVLRLEHKIDLLLKHFKPQSTPMHFVGQMCPVCNTPVDYQIDMAAGVVIRKCNCKSGKLPPMYQITPIPTEVNTNASQSPKTEPGNAVDTDSPRGSKTGRRG